MSKYKRRAKYVRIHPHNDYGILAVRRDGPTLARRITSAVGAQSHISARRTHVQLAASCLVRAVVHPVRLVSGLGLELAAGLPEVDHPRAVRNAEGSLARRFSLYQLILLAMVPNLPNIFAINSSANA